jgi:hypothetical protein
MFGPLKHALCGWQFANDEEVKDVMHMWLHMQPETFFADGIRKLMYQSNKCAEKLRNYIKK